MAGKTSISFKQSKLFYTVFVLIALQPMMDALSYWLLKTGTGSLPTLLLRFCLLAFTVALGFISAEKKDPYYILCGVLSLFTLLHAAVCFFYGYDDIIGDLTNMVRIYQLPLTAFSFISFIKKDRSCIKAALSGFAASFLIICLITCLASLTGTDPHTYAGKGIGVLGWFFTPNVQSAILSMVIPVFLVYSLTRKDRSLKLFIPSCILIFAALFLFATRLAYASLIATTAILGFVCIFWKKLGKENLTKYGAVLLAFALLSVLLIPLSPMTENRSQLGANENAKQEDIDSLVAQDTEKARESGLEGEELRLASLKGAYEKYLPGIVGKFGLESAAEIFGYSTSVFDIANNRTQRINYCKLLLKQQPLSVLFGLELADLSYGDTVYDVENDFHGMFFLCGGAGLLLTLLFLGYFILKTALALIKSFKPTFTLVLSGFAVSLCCGLAHAYFTSGVLRRPNANFYLAIICAVLYCITNKNHEENPQ